MAAARAAPPPSTRAVIDLDDTDPVPEEDPPARSAGAAPRRAGRRRRRRLRGRLRQSLAVQPYSSNEGPLAVVMVARWAPLLSDLVRERESIYGQGLVTKLGRPEAEFFARAPSDSRYRRTCDPKHRREPQSTGQRLRARFGVLRVYAAKIRKSPTTHSRAGTSSRPYARRDHRWWRAAGRARAPRPR
jgi:hypothetical protein